MKTEYVIIAALAAENRLIGHDMDLPWHIPADLKRFKALTVGHPLLMGRKTFLSVLHQFGGPLPKRRNVILTHSGPIPGHESIETYGSLQEAQQALAHEKRVFVGGGATLYQQFLPLADRLELTLVDGHYEGDTYFPPYAHLIGTEYQETAREEHEGFRFITYLRS